MHSMQPSPNYFGVLFHLLQTFHHYLPVTVYNADNRLLGTENTKLSLGELNGRS